MIVMENRTEMHHIFFRERDRLLISSLPVLQPYAKFRVCLTYSFPIVEERLKITAILH